MSGHTAVACFMEDSGVATIAKLRARMQQTCTCMPPETQHSQWPPRDVLVLLAIKNLEMQCC